MRAIFLILLSANLLFLGWSEWIDPPSEASNQDAVSRLPRLELVTEGPVAPRPTSGLAHEMRAPQLTEACTSVGPFNDLTSAARVAGLLSGRGFHPQQRAEEGETIEGYWVFVGGMQSDDEVNHVVDRLEKSGFTDAHIMKNSSKGRRVSVGMFSTRERAERRAAAVKHLGFEPEIGERSFPGTVYWVDVAVAPGIQRLPPEYSFADIGHAKVAVQPCPPGAKPPGVTDPGREGDGLTKPLPRTTVASAPPRN